MTIIYFLKGKRKKKESKEEGSRIEHGELFCSKTISKKIFLNYALIINS
jgi:hypothetical protein